MKRESAMAVSPDPSSSTPSPAFEAGLLEGLVTLPATQARRRWRAVRRAALNGPGVAITRRGEVELVVLSRERVEALERAALAVGATGHPSGGAPGAVLDQLRARFMERLHNRDHEAINRALESAADKRTNPGGRLHVDDRF